MGQQKPIILCVAAMTVMAGCRNPDKNKERLRLADVVLPEQSGPIRVHGALAHRPRNEYTLLVSDRTEGLFPGTIAVARIAPHWTPTHTLVPASSLEMKPLNQFIDWCDMFDDIWPVAGVFPLTYPNRPNRQVTEQMLVDAAREQGAGMCLIYHIGGECDQNGCSAVMRGQLYDVRDGRLLAEAHADARVKAIFEDQLPPPPPTDRIDIDKRHLDPWFIAHERFRQKLRECVLELIAQDKPIEAPIPSRRQTVSGYPPIRNRIPTDY